MVLMVDPSGDVLDVPEVGVRALVALGWRVQDAAPAAPAPAVEPADDSVPEPEVLGAGELPRPHTRASRGDWAEYARALGLEPGKMTRAEIVRLVDEGGGVSDGESDD